MFEETSSSRSDSPLGPKGAPPVAPTRFLAHCHPLVEQISREVDGYFLQHWPFPNQKARKKFVDAGFSRITCLFFPKARPERVGFACRLLTILFLIDDLLEYLSFEDGKQYNARLMPLCEGNRLPDKTLPVEWMMYDLWEEMRACDKTLSDDILGPTFTFMRAQTDEERVHISTLKDYFEYRRGDVGKGVLSALMCFTMGLHMTTREVSALETIEANGANHIAVVNDILSWEKEVATAKSSNQEGATMCSAVQVVKLETGLPIEACKRVLWALCRECEVRHEQMAAEILEQRHQQGEDGMSGKSKSSDLAA